VPSGVYLRSEEHKRNIGKAHKGRKLSKEHREKMSKAHLGIKLSQEHRDALSRVALGKRLSDEHKRRMSLGRIGMKFSDEHRRNISKSHKGRKVSEETRRRIGIANSISLKGKKLTEEHKKNIGRKKRSEEFRRNLSKFRMGKKLSEETKLRISKAHIGKHLSEEHLRNLIRGLRKRPTSLELQFQQIINKYNLPYKYCGDGSFIVGFKNPDFFNINGDKICIEVANRYHHPEPYKENRIRHFDKWGWECMVFFEDELEESKVLEAIKQKK